MPKFILTPLLRCRWLAPAAVALLTACDLGTLPPGVPQSEALRLRHLCADSFQIANRLLNEGEADLPVRLAATWVRPGSRVPQGVTAQVRVPWAPNASEASQITFRLAIPTDQKVQVVATPVAGLPTRSLTTTNDGPATCRSVALVRVRSAIGLGLTGTITPLADSLPAGALLRWSFSPADGSDGVDVRINGVRQSAAGSVVVSGEITITAVGVVATTLPATVVPLIEETRVLLASPTPRAAAERLLNRLVALLDGVDEATGEQLLAAYQEGVLSADLDPAAMERLDSLLGNAVLPVEIPSTPALRGPPPPFPAEPTTYFIAAGILTSQQKLAATARVVSTLIRDRAMLGANDLVRAFVSPSMTGVGADVRNCIARTLAPASPREKVNGFLTHCLLLYGSILDGIDFVEATSQILKQWVGGIPTRNTSLTFMDSLRQYREQGYHLIVDAHSQGTLIAREAIAELESRQLYRPDRDSTCIGVVAMAGPTSGAWRIPDPYLREFATEGDLVAAMGGSHAVRVTTDLTQQRDSALATIPASATWTRIAVSLVYALQLHDLQQVYLGQSAPRNYLLASNRLIRGECEAKELRSTLPDGRIAISRGEQFPLALYFQPFNHAGRALKGRSVRLVAAESPMVELIDQVTILGKQNGQTAVTARSGQVEGTSLVEVRAPPVLGLAGSYAGEWKIPLSGLGGSLALTLTEPGTVTRDGEVQVEGSVSYTHPAGSFTWPLHQGRVTMGGVATTIVFQMGTPEFPDPDSWATVTLEAAPNQRLLGRATLYFAGGLIREGRIWELARKP